MAAITVKQLCNKCHMEMEIDTSGECQQCFSALHLKKHQQELIMQTKNIEQEYDLFRRDFTQEGVVNPLPYHVIIQQLVWVEDSEKCSLLLDLLKSQTGTDVSTLIFVKTKRAVNELSKLLEDHHHAATSIHGDRSQAQREEAIRSFKTGRTPILIATDVAVRGHDILNIKHIINFDLPSDICHYRERIGRTGQVGRQGQATSFFNEENLLIAADLLEILRESNQEVPEWLEGLARETNKNHNHPSSSYASSQPSSIPGNLHGRLSTGNSCDHGAQTRQPQLVEQCFVRNHWKNKKRHPS